MKIFILIVIILLALCLLLENCLLLEVRRTEVKYKDTGSHEPVRIVQISDLHKRRFGHDNSRITELARGEKPDLIFVTGDLVSRTETDFMAKERFLQELCSIAPVYFIYGNHEQGLPEEYQQSFAAALELSGVRVLHNEIVQTQVRGRKLNIAGLEPKYSVYIKNERYRDLDRITDRDMKELLGERPEGETLLLAHNPLFGQEYCSWGADFTFSGHVHGGVVRLFGVGLLSPERKLLPEYTKGTYVLTRPEGGAMILFVSAGLGKLRLFNPPEIVSYII